jgi:hypothetical protein
MKRSIIAAILLLNGALGAHADTSTYYSIGGPRTDDALQLAGHYCDQRLGPVKNGAVTSAAYKKCMAGQGWRYGHTTREHTWIDPDTGDTCHDILGGLGSSCGNF